MFDQNKMENLKNLKILSKKWNFLTKNCIFNIPHHFFSLCDQEKSFSSYFFTSDRLCLVKIKCSNFEMEKFSEKCHFLMKNPFLNISNSLPRVVTENKVVPRKISLREDTKIVKNGQVGQNGDNFLQKSSIWLIVNNKKKLFLKILMKKVVKTVF